MEQPPWPPPTHTRNSPVMTTTDVPRHGQVSPGGRISRVRPCGRGSNSCLNCPRCHGKHHVAWSPESELQPAGRGFRALWAAAGAPLAGFCAGPHNYIGIIYAVRKAGTAETVTFREQNVLRFLTVYLGSSFRRTACPWRELIIMCISTHPGQIRSG